MKEKYSLRDRNELKLKFAEVFDANIQVLSSDFRMLLLDDLVTAFENRMKVLSKVKSEVKVELAASVDYEKIKA